MYSRNALAVAFCCEDFRITHACSIGGYSLAGISKYRPFPFIFGDTASESATMPVSAAPETMNDAVCEMFSPRMNFLESLSYRFSALSAETAACPYGACCGFAMAIFLTEGSSNVFKPELMSSFESFNTQRTTFPVAY